MTDVENEICEVEHLVKLAAREICLGKCGYPDNGWYDEGAREVRREWQRYEKDARSAVYALRDAGVFATVKPGLTVGAHHDPELPPGEYVVAIDTVGGAATVNAPADDDTIADLRTRLEAAERERNAALSALSARYDISNGDWGQAAAEAAQSILLVLGQYQSPSMEPGADHRRDRVAKIIDEALSAAIARAEKAEAERDALAGPLTHRGFACTREHAVECAYLLSLAEADDDDVGEAMTIVELYISGDMPIGEAITILEPANPEPAHA